MRAGKLDRQINIERATTVIDDAGTPTQTWAVLAPLRAELVEASADEANGAGGESTQHSVLFRTRYLAGITVADRITYAGQAFNIKHVKEIGRRRGLEIKAERLGP